MPNPNANTNTVEKCRNILSLTEETVSLTQCPQGANLHMVLKRVLEPQTAGPNPSIRAETLDTYCHAHRLFCYPQSYNRRSDCDIGQANPQFIARIKEIINPRRNTPPFGATATWAIDADISINIIMLLCTATNEMTKRNEKVLALLLL